MDLNFSVEGSDKNTSKLKIKNTRFSEEVFLVVVENLSSESQTIKRDISTSLVQFYLSAEGGGIFKFNEGNYSLKLKPQHALLFYNPVKALPLHIELKPHSRVVFLYITVNQLHQLFVEGSEEMSFINQDNIGKKYYADRQLRAPLLLVLNQLFQDIISGPASAVYFQSKAYEILAHFFNREEGMDVEQCPFLNDEQNVARVREAKTIIMSRVNQPPTLKELAQEVGLNEYKLKEGFKNIYGKTVFQFLNDYRLDTARHMLDSGNHKVNDAAYNIGYTNPSHFITAFRKKFGMTPKKYLLSKN